ncbi:MAG: hypothetical protein AAGK00_01550 [Pseudomonadota bacterium]
MGIALRVFAFLFSMFAVLLPLKAAATLYDTTCFDVGASASELRVCENRAGGHSKGGKISILITVNVDVGSDSTILENLKKSSVRMNFDLEESCEIEAIVVAVDPDQRKKVRFRVFIDTAERPYLEGTCTEAKKFVQRVKATC